MLGVGRVVVAIDVWAYAAVRTGRRRADGRSRTIEPPTIAVDPESHVPDETAATSGAAHALSPAARHFLDSPERYGTLATINADGSPHQAVIWYRLDEDDSILINSAIGRRWPANVLRDPRCSLVAEDGLDYVAVRGTAEPAGQGEIAQRDIAALAVRYDGPEDAARQVREKFSRQERISFRIRIDGSYEHLEG